MYGIASRGIIPDENHGERGNVSLRSNDVSASGLIPPARYAHP